MYLEGRSKEWEREAKQLFDSLSQKVNDSNTLVKVAKERRGVRTILLSYLIESGQEEFLPLIADILKEHHVDWHYQIPRKLFQHFPLELLERIICPVAKEYIKKGKTPPRPFQNVYSPTGNFHLFWYGSILLQSDDLKRYYRERLQSLKNLTHKDLSIEDVVSAKVLRLDEEIKSLRNIGQNLILSRQQFDRALGLYIIVAGDNGDSKAIISAMLTDRASFVRGSAKGLMAAIKTNQSIRACWIKELWHTYFITSYRNTISEDLLSRLENYRGLSEKARKAVENFSNLERKQISRRKSYRDSHIIDTNNITSYISERDLESILAENPERLEEGLQLIKRQYDCPGIGRIDLLCKDRKENLVVVELKKYGVKHDSVMYQILSYKRYVEKHIAKRNQKVRGIVVVGKIDERLRYAVEAVPGVTVKAFNLTIE